MISEGRGRRASYPSRRRSRLEHGGGRGWNNRQPYANGEGREQYGQSGHNAFAGQPGLNDALPPGVLEAGKTYHGIVVALLESYGFIRRVVSDMQ